jgi:hypothetical protein
VRALAGGIVFGGDGRPRAVELFGSPGARESLQRMQAESPFVSGQGRQRRRAAHVRDPRPGQDGGGNARDRGIGHAEQHQIRARRRRRRPRGPVPSASRGRLPTRPRPMTFTAENIVLPTDHST